MFDAEEDAFDGVDSSNFFNGLRRSSSAPAMSENFMNAELPGIGQNVLDFIANNGLVVPSTADHPIQLTGTGTGDGLLQSRMGLVDETSPITHHDAYAGLFRGTDSVDIEGPFEGH